MGKDEATPEKDFSFTKAERLLKPAEFTEARKLGKRLSTRSFNIYLLENRLGIRRLGLSISSRVGPAVRRNRIKRLLREFFRLNKAIFPASTDILVTGKGAERIKCFKDIEEELRAALIRGA